MIFCSWEMGIIRIEISNNSSTAILALWWMQSLVKISQKFLKHRTSGFLDSWPICPCPLDHVHTFFLTFFAMGHTTVSAFCLQVTWYLYKFCRHLSLSFTALCPCRQWGISSVVLAVARVPVSNIYLCSTFVRWHNFSLKYLFSHAFSIPLRFPKFIHLFAVLIVNFVIILSVTFSHCISPSGQCFVSIRTQERSCD